MSSNLIIVQYSDESRFVMSSTVGAQILNTLGFRMVEHVLFMAPTIQKPNIQNCRSKLCGFIYKFFLNKKQPSLEPKFGFRMVRTIRKPNKMATILFFTIRKPNFKTFGIRMDSEFKCSEFEPRLYSNRY